MYGTYLLTFWPFIFIIKLSLAGSISPWHLKTAAIYGRKVTLQCNVPDGACSQKDSKFWSGGKNYTLLCFAEICTNSLKYQMTLTSNFLAFQLAILNFSQSDDKSNYSCTCGFWHGTRLLNSADHPDDSAPSASNTIKIIVPVVIVAIIVAFLIIIACVFRKDAWKICEHLKEYCCTFCRLTKEERKKTEATAELTATFSLLN